MEISNIKLLSSIALTVMLASCRIDTTVTGAGTISSQTGKIQCPSAGVGACSAEYTTAGPERLYAVPKPGHKRTFWDCSSGLGLCSFTISANYANDPIFVVPYNAKFEPVLPAAKAAVFTYNAAGQRVAKTVTGITTLYVYNSEGQLIAETNSSGVTLVEYIYLDGEQIAQVLNTNTASEATYYVHNDHLNTPKRISKSDRVFAWGMETTPFGETYAEQSSVTSNIRFPGQYFDSESGLHYNYFRDYDPSIGRYVESDPIGLAGGLNTYSYVHGNPLSYSDPNGELALLPGAALGGLTDLAFQLAMNGGRFECVSWSQVAGSSALGAAGAGIGNALQKARYIRQAYQNGLAAGRNFNLSAQQAHALRRQLGAELKSQTPQPFREMIYSRNVAQYGDKLGPAFDPVRNANVAKTLTDTNAIADSILLLPGRGLGGAGAVAGGLVGGTGSDACGCN